VTKKSTISCQGGWASGIVFQKGATSRLALLMGDRATGAFAIFAKRNGGQVIENKRFREMRHFAPRMISRGYDPGAKRFISRREMNPFVFAGCPPRRDPKRNAAKSEALPGSRGGRL
jgi:hypothetical protein